jgi:hypothetical protein
MTNHHDRPIDHRLDCGRDVSCEIVVGDAVHGAGAPAHAPRLRQNNLEARVNEALRQVVEIF